MIKGISIFLTAFLTGLALPLHAEVQDTLVVPSSGYTLDSTMVYGSPSSMLDISRSGAVRMDMDLIDAFPKFLSNTDPVNMLKLLPGVQTISEFDSGIYVQGCDDAHNVVMINGVPIYGAAHIFGFFSIFNPSHFKTAGFERSAFRGAGLNRLGASIDMRPRGFEKEKVTGSLDLGVIFSQGTFSWRTSKKTQLHLSARQSYMNLIYGRWMKFMDFPMKYNFGDYNLSFCYDPTERDQLRLEGYFGRDAVRVHHPQNKALGIDMVWGNYAASLHWDHAFTDSRLLQKLFVTNYRMDWHLAQDVNQVRLHSQIRTIGYTGEYLWKDLSAGGELLWHDVCPQHPVISNGNVTTASPRERQTGLEGSIHADYSHQFNFGLGLSAGAKGIFYLDPERHPRGAFSPSASLWYEHPRYGRVSLAYAWQHQFLFKTGMPNMGMPVTFWFLAGKHSAPQSAHSTSLSYHLDFSRKRYALEINLYFKRLAHQVDYRGNLLDFFTMDYDLDHFLLKGKGINYGAHFMIQKLTGPFTGWVSYSIGRSLRRFSEDNYSKVYPSNHERIHELNVVAAYKLRRWDFSGAFVFASGLPFTPPEGLYQTSGHIVTSYGEHNSCRLMPYLRLDLSVGLKFIDRPGQEFGGNFSVLNATGWRNPVNMMLKMEEDGFLFVPSSFTLRFIPSVSLYYKF